MTLPRREHPEARREAYEAAVWYADQEPRLAERFAHEAQDALDFVCEWPGGAPPYRDLERTPSIRSKRVNGFPYRIVYLVQNDEVVVIAYAHESRRPGYWRSRLKDV
ncbi:type II toxin-antitoxin system RelE/ParE family toxin [Georgenia sp. TF02-10]|uniref:type II toxin-antitoxin system RelE/ParE family toxin n=1 Tax=Georgenia sp. TF02-10 TaxID=2917725 RepID=UPI001FA7CFE0|nr:type II toxin-antitoxin system RelE/ParE family toxin [Georgenia sp. TF02-10]UNX54973.1 type II toxin-antitoxin system RelE/ParE family toxin [Georgenia sp. TF02-10]